MQHAPATIESSNPWGGVVSHEALQGSANYWELRYRSGGHSGLGSRGVLAEFKAEVVNTITSASNFTTAIEFGCGDGVQAGFLQVPDYLGIDVSPTAVALCRERFQGQSGRQFLHASEYSGQRAALALSLDVVYHLVEDEVFERYMTQLFDAAQQMVVIYSSDPDHDVGTPYPHVKHRAVSAWVARNRSDAVFVGVIPNRYPYHQDPVNGSHSDFLLFRKQG